MDDRGTTLIPLENYLRPTLVTSLDERRKSVLVEYSDRMKHMFDNLQRNLMRFIFIYVYGLAGKSF